MVEEDSSSCITRLSPMRWEFRYENRLLDLCHDAGSALLLSFSNDSTPSFQPSSSPVISGKWYRVGAYDGNYPQDSQFGCLSDYLVHLLPLADALIEPDLGKRRLLGHRCAG